MSGFQQEICGCELPATRDRHSISKFTGLLLREGVPGRLHFALLGSHLYGIRINCHWTKPAWHPQDPRSHTLGYSGSTILQHRH